MKIIEVILANQDSQEEEEDIIYKKKMYEILKREMEENNSQKEIQIKQAKSEKQKEDPELLNINNVSGEQS